MEENSPFIPGVPCSPICELASEIAASFCQAQTTEEKEKIAQQIAILIERKLHFSEHLNELTALISTLGILGHDLRNYLIPFTIDRDVQQYASAKETE